jgi:hypothetical protein
LGGELAFELRQFRSRAFRLFPVRDEVRLVGQCSGECSDIARLTDLGEIVFRPLQVRSIAVSLDGELRVQGRSLAAFFAQAFDLGACRHID